MWRKRRRKEVVYERQKKYMFMLLALFFTVSLQLPIMASTPSGVTTTQYVPNKPLWQNVNSATARLTFSGTTAHCSAIIAGLSGTTSITATMRLERVNGNSATTVATWTQTVNGSRLVMSESNAVTANGTYRLRVDATVVRNGVSESISISG